MIEVKTCKMNHVTVTMNHITVTIGSGIQKERFEFCLKMGEVTVTFTLPWRKDIRLTLAEVMAVYAFLTKEMAVESGNKKV